MNDDMLLQVVTVTVETSDDPELYEPRFTWEGVNFADTFDVEDDLRLSERRQDAFDTDPGEFRADSILSSFGWVGDCRENG